jgi:hypothetical protein
MNVNAFATDPIFEKTSNDIFAVLANKHSFDLKALTPSEAQRLLNFVQIADMGRYPEFSGWPEKVFLTARLSCEQKLHALIGQSST